MKTIENIFKNASHQQHFDEYGYVIIDLFSKNDIQKLEEEFIDLTPPEHLKTFTTWAVNDYNYKKNIDLAIKNHLSENAENILLRHYAFWGNFMIKPSNPDSFIPLHADWTYVDEEYDVSLNMWTPLTDTSQSNGSLCVIPNSNRVIKFIRGVNLYRFYAPNAGDIIKSYGKQLNIRLGQAIIYDHKLLHYSLANVSGIDRRAATLVFMPKNRQLFHYSSNDEGNDISEYKISSPEFFFSNNFYETPKEIPKRIFKSDFFSDLTLNDFE